MSGWQLIESAPRDGTEIDLWVASSEPEYDGRKTDCRWKDGAWRRYDDMQSDYLDVEEGPESLNDGRVCWERATHWMPKPRSPNTPPPVAKWDEKRFLWTVNGSMAPGVPIVGEVD